MRAILGKLSRDRRGSTIPVGALCAFALIAAAAFGADFYLWKLEDGRLQRVTDAGALSAGRALAEGRTAQADLLAIVNAEAEVMNYGPSRGVTFTVAIDGIDTVNVTGSKPNLSYFSKIFGVTLPATSAEATVTVGLDGTPLCVLALEDNPVENFGVKVHNSGYIVAPECRVHSNSQDVNTQEWVEEGSIYVRNGEITTASTCAVGSATISANGWSTVSPAPHSGCPKADDPVGHVPNPLPASYGNTCLPDPKVDGSWNGFRQLNPGHYCDGITIANGVRARFKAGTYYIGGTGLIVGGGAELHGANNGRTSVIVYEGDVTLDNGADLEWSAPLSGPYAGILLWRTNDTPCTKPVTFGGAVKFTFDGALYFPNCHVEVNNSAEIQTDHHFTLIVGRSFQVWGGAEVNIHANEPFGQPICIPAGAGGVGLSRPKGAAP